MRNTVFHSPVMLLFSHRFFSGSLLLPNDFTGLASEHPGTLEQDFPNQNLKTYS